VHGTFLDNLGGVIFEIAAESWFVTVLFYVFILLAAMTVLNMLIGVLCEVVSAVAATEKEALTVAYVKSKVEEVISEFGVDEDGDRRVSKREFKKILEIPSACNALQEVDVDVVGLVDIADFIFEEEDKDDEEGKPKEEKALSFEEFMDLVLSLRSSNSATVKDIVDLRKFIHKEHVATREQLTSGRKEIRRAASSQGGPRCAANVAIGFGGANDVTSFDMHPASNPYWGRQQSHQRMLSEKTATLQQILTLGSSELQRYMDSLVTCDTLIISEVSELGDSIRQPRPEDLDRSEVKVLKEAREAVESAMNTLQRVQNRLP
jgi:hypothetical protein